MKLCHYWKPNREQSFLISYWNDKGRVDKRKIYQQAWFGLRRQLQTNHKHQSRVGGEGPFSQDQ